MAFAAPSEGELGRRHAASQRGFYRLLGDGAPGSRLFELGEIQATVVPVCPGFSIFNSVLYGDARALPEALADQPSWGDVARCNDRAHGVLEPWQHGRGVHRGWRSRRPPHAALRDDEVGSALVARERDRDCYFWFVASELMRHALREARGRGCETTTLDDADHNHSELCPSRRWSAPTGYTQTQPEHHPDAHPQSRTTRRARLRYRCSSAPLALT